MLRHCKKDVKKTMEKGFYFVASDLSHFGIFTQNLRMESGNHYNKSLYAFSRPLCIHFTLNEVRCDIFHLFLSFNKFDYYSMIDVVTIDTRNILKYKLFAYPLKCEQLLSFSPGFN